MAKNQTLNEFLEDEVRKFEAKVNRLPRPAVCPLLAPIVSDAQVVHIAVKSWWTSMKGEKEEEFVISGSKGEYVGKGKTVEARSIEALLTALDEPGVTAPSILNCGIDPALLLLNHELQLREYLNGRTTGFLHGQLAKALEFYKRQFADLSLAQEAFAKSFDYEKLGIFKEISVTVTVDGDQFVVSSASNHLFFCHGLPDFIIFLIDVRSG